MWIERYGKVALTGEPDHFQDQFGPLDRWFEVSVYRTEPGRFAVVFFDITQRKAAEEALQASNARLTDILNSMTDGFVSVDPAWRFTLVNARAGELLKLSSVEVLGKSMEDLCPDLVGWREYRKVMAERAPETFEVWSQPLETWLEVHAYPTSAGMSILFTDISQRKLTEAAAQARLRILTAAGTSDRSSDEMIRLVLDEIERLTGSEIGFYHFVEADQETLWLQNWSTNTLTNMCSAEGKGSHYAISEAGVWVDAVHERRAVIHNDYQSLPNRKGMPEGHAPVTRELVVPILRRDRIVALIGVGNKATDYDDADIDTVSHLGDLSWEIVERRRAEQSLVESRERADLFAAMLDKSSQPFAAATGDGRLLVFNTAYEELLGYSTDELHVLSWRTDLTPPEWQELDDATIRVQIGDGEPVRYEKEYLRKDGSRVPVEVVRNVHLNERGEVDYFYAFFTDITQRKRTERLSQALEDIDRTIHSTLDLDTIMSRVAAAAAAALHCDSAEVILLEGDAWVRRYGHGVEGSDLGRRLTLQESPAVLRAAQARRTILLDVATTDDPALAAPYAQEGVASVLAAPMTARDEAIGVLAFAHRSSPGSFGPTDVEFAEDLAASLSLGVQNARLYERERTIADTLQEAVLSPPEPIESLEVSYLYRPALAAANVGGDFYDLFKTDEGHVVFVIGDISGKGVGAARMTSLVRDGIRAYAYDGADPGWILNRVNRLMHRVSPIEVFSTVFLGVLDTDTGLLRFCGGGHPPAIVVPAGGGERLLLESSSAIVGAFARLEFVTEEVHLEAGDTLVLYTDGITEGRRNGELFGQQRLLDLLETLRTLPLEQLPKAILQGVLDYTGGAQSDDVVVVCIRTKPPRGAVN